MRAPGYRDIIAKHRAAAAAARVKRERARAAKRRRDALARGLDDCAWLLLALFFAAVVSFGCAALSLTSSY